MNDGADNGNAGAGNVSNLADDAASKLNADADKGAAAGDGKAGAAQQNDGKKARPEFLDEAFWDNEKGEAKLEALAKSQKDLRTKISQGLKEPPPEKPDGYKFMPDEGVKLDDKDPGLMLARNVAHKAGMGQAQFNDFVNQFMKDVPALLEQVSAPPSPEQQAEANKAELAKLHSDPAQAQKLVNHVVSFFKGKVEQGILSTEDYQALMRMGGDAAGIKALQKVISTVYNEENVPAYESNADDGYSVDDYYRDVGTERYDSDPSFRDQVRNKLGKLLERYPGGLPPKGTGIPAGSSFQFPHEREKAKAKR